MKVGMNKVAAVLTSFAMMSGLFMGMKLDAKANKQYEVTNPWESQNATVYNGDEITLLWATDNYTLNVYYQIKLNDSSIIEIDKYQCTIDHIYKTNCIYTVSSKIYDGKTYNTYTLTYAMPHFEGGNPCYNVYLTADVLSSEISSTLGESMPSSTNDIAPHIHDFQWITSIDPQCGADGLEEYKCVGCGIVQESHTIPAGIALVKDLYGKVKEAAINGEVICDFGKLATISDYLLTKMAERNDVAVTIQFEYNGGKHQLTFPAGTDYTAVLIDADNMYGFYGIASKLGLTVTDIAK